MTRDEHRAKCIEAMREAYGKAWSQSKTKKFSWQSGLTAAFDALHGVAFIDPIEATEDMVLAGLSKFTVRQRWRAMSARGDLTNPPEETP